MKASYCQLLKTVFSNAEIVTDRIHILIAASINHVYRSWIVSKPHTLKTKKVPSTQRYWNLLLKRFHGIIRTAQTALSPAFQTPISHNERLSYRVLWNFTPISSKKLSGWQEIWMHAFLNYSNKNITQKWIGVTFYNHQDSFLT